MFNKNSNKNLWIVFAILLIAVVLIFNSESTKKERSFRKNLVSIDTSSVSSFSIFPKSKNGLEVKFLKHDEVWKVFDENDISYTVPDFKIKNIFGELIKIKPKRVAARSKAKWTEYQVDSAATRVVINENGSEVLNLIIGKFAFQQPRSMSTFVRIMGESDVYEVDGFLDMTFNKDVNSFRDETVIKGDPKNWNKLTFEYPADSSFNLVKVDDKWLLNGSQYLDSAITEQLLSKISRINSTDYIDNFDKSILGTVFSKLIIETIDGENLIISAYKNESSYIISTNLNNENYFDGSKVGSKVFTSSASFLNE